MNESSENGQIITFYSYKGGTGRTMALANIACLLAKSKIKGRGVLIIDWDLEAPGLHLFLKDILKGQFIDSIDYENDFDKFPGIIDLFMEVKNLLTRGDAKYIDDVEIIKIFKNIDLKKYIIKTDINSLYFIKAGNFSDDYSSKISTFKWRDLFERVPNLFRIFAEHLSGEYSYVLIDSRTGFSDTSGICTMLLPSKLVVVFTPNNQSLKGLGKLVQQATEYRKQSDDLRPLVVFPLASRVELAERVLYEDWRYGNIEQGIQGYQSQFEILFSSVYDFPNCSLNDYFDEVQIQHVPAYAFGEKIAVLVERGKDRLSIARSYVSFADWLVNFSAPWEIQERIKDVSDPPCTHVVNKKSKIGYSTINEAIKAARAGDKIIIYPGIYNEKLIIDKHLELVGEGNVRDIIVEGRGNSALLFTTGRGRVSNLSFKQLADGNCYCLDITQGHLDLEGCDISSESLGGIVIRRNAEPRVFNNNIHDCRNIGILMINNAQGSLENNSIFNNNSNGMEIADNSNAILRKNRIYDNRQNGIMIYNGGKSVFEENDIFGNDLSGVVVKESGNPIFRRNKIYKGKRGGVLIHNKGLGEFEENDIFQNALAGVEISDLSSPILRHNRIHDGEQNGILINGNSNGLIENNDIFGNISDNIEIGKESNSVFRCNLIHGGKANGIYAHSNSQPMIEGNDIFDNAQAGVRIRSGSNPILCRNRIHDGGGAGIFILEKGRSLVEDNDIYNNARAGIAIEAGGDPILRHNRVNRNGFEAICVHYKGAGIIEDNDLRFNAKGAWDISQDSRYYVKISGNLE